MRFRPDRLVDDIEALYGRDYQSYVRVARAITGDRERAIEAVQEGFANALQARRTFRGEGSLEAWVWRIVVNAARSAARSPLVEAPLNGAFRLETPPPLVELAPLIAALPERQRHAVFLRYYADLDYRSIAAVLGVEVGTVSATLAAAHQAVRRSLMEVVPHD
jgi:RNA polymerase sigma-70 factor (ECF subfamily)